MDSAFHPLTRGTGEMYYKNCLATVAHFIACEFSSLWIICYILIVFIYNSTVLLLLLYLSICDFDTTSILSIIGRLLFDFSSVFYTLLQIHLGIYLGKRIWMIVRLRKS